MNYKLSVLFALLFILLLSCSKDKDKSSAPKADFTAIAGDWKGFSSADVDIFTISGRGTIVAVTDAKVNSSTLNGGTLLMYVRNQGSASTTYNQVPYNDAVLGNVSKNELSVSGLTLKITNSPASADRAKLSLRVIIIPAGKSIPASINAANYTEVAAFLGIN